MTALAFSRGNAPRCHGVSLGAGLALVPVGTVGTVGTPPHETLQAVGSAGCLPGTVTLLHQPRRVPHHRVGVNTLLPSWAREAGGENWRGPGRHVPTATPSPSAPHSTAANHNPTPRTPAMASGRPRPCGDHSHQPHSPLLMRSSRGAGTAGPGAPWRAQPGPSGVTRRAWRRGLLPQRMAAGTMLARV